MKKPLVVWIFQTGEPLQIDKGDSRPMRAINLSNFLVEAGHEVILWSSDFYHQKKVHRFNSNKRIKVSEKLEIRLLKSKGYKRNISFSRMIDHLQLANSLRKELRKEISIPDIAFIGYPPIEAAVVLSNWLKKRSVPTLLDIKDQWPALFIDSLPMFTKSIGRVVLWPYFYLANKVISDSSGISSMSNGFISWVKDFNGEDKLKTYRVFPLTSQNENISEIELNKARNWWDDLCVNTNSSINVCFVGSLSQAFDFKSIKNAAIRSNLKGKNIKFIICGDGDEAQKIKGLFADLPNVIFPGWINRSQIVTLSERCVASIAPYKNTDNFIANIPNKIIDSISLCLPILSPLEGEVKNLINKYKIGFNYNEDSDEELLNLVLKIDQDKALQDQLAKNMVNLYNEKFSYEIIYKDLVRHLENMSEINKNYES